MFMNFIQLAQTRFSVRNYKSQSIEEEKLKQVLEACRIAPSAANFQPWHFIVINQKEKLEEIYSTYHGKWIKSAPVIIVACSDHSKSWKRGSDGKDSADIDIAIAIDHLTLMATQLKLGTCWVCNFNAELCVEIFKLPRQIEPIALIPIGYPADVPKTKSRKALDEIVHYNKFKTRR